jgi:hypothetical protein
MLGAWLGGKRRGEIYAFLKASLEAKRSAWEIDCLGDEKINKSLDWPIKGRPVSTSASLTLALALLLLSSARLGSTFLKSRSIKIPSIKISKPMNFTSHTLLS